MIIKKHCIVDRNIATDMLKLPSSKHFPRYYRICVASLLVILILGCASVPKGFKEAHSGAVYHIRSGTLIPRKLGSYILHTVFDRYYGTIGFGAAYIDEYNKKALLFVYVYPLTLWDQTSSIEREAAAVKNFYGVESSETIEYFEKKSETNATIALLYTSDEGNQNTSAACVDIRITGEWIVRKWAMWFNLPSDDIELESLRRVIEPLPSPAPTENVAF